MDTKSAMLRFKMRTKETGQALVLIAMLVVILLAFLGLAIDGGGMFLLWRDAQNAVDTAALQAAFSYCTSNKDFQAAIDAGISAANANGFDNNAVDNWVTVEPAPAARRPSNVYISDTNAIMLVTIKAVKPAYFIQLVYGGPLEVTVDTIGICSPATESMYEGYSMFAMASNGVCGYSNTPNTGHTAQISPNGSSQHYFGPWFSNGNASVGGGGGGITFYDDAGIDFVGGTAGFDSKAEMDGGGAITTNQVSQVDYFPPLYSIEEFMPASTTYTDNLGVSHTTGSAAGQYWAEAYAQGSSKAQYFAGGAPLNGTLNGLYVVMGDVNLKGTIGNGVTIVAMGDVKSTGQLNTLNNVWQPYVAGLTIMSLSGQDSPNCAVNNSTAISFSGPGIIGFGILYAPYSGISMSGANSAWCGAFIANAIDRSGSDTWVFGQTIPDATRLAALGVPGDFHTYAGRTCDYIDQDTPPYYGLGD